MPLCFSLLNIDACFFLFSSSHLTRAPLAGVHGASLGEGKHQLPFPAGIGGRRPHRDESFEYIRENVTKKRYFVQLPTHSQSTGKLAAQLLSIHKLNLYHSVAGSVEG